ncbi:hypothetical protein ACFQ3L_02610 [Lacticaseibacillus jixianensis]|uniref:Uncharacterized protein n=1 Tax=Lacticaseibacillus jixianensis TaxID=2486012 RepID=A0ABW4B624_9LACO|nr:hypothetical protein [Lacticaseibacillus jixianensis]
MKPNEEWVKRFAAANGRMPTKEEYEAAKQTGFSEPEQTAPDQDPDRDKAGAAAAPAASAAQAASTPQPAKQLNGHGGAKHAAKPRAAKRAAKQKRPFYRHKWVWAVAAAVVVLATAGAFALSRQRGAADQPKGNEPRASRTAKQRLPLKTSRQAVLWMAQQKPQAGNQKLTWRVMGTGEDASFTVTGTGGRYFWLRGRRGNQPAKQGEDDYDGLDYLVEAQSGKLIPDTAAKFNDLLGARVTGAAAAGSSAAKASSATSQSGPETQAAGGPADDASLFLNLGTVTGEYHEDAATTGPAGAMTSEFSNTGNSADWVSRNADGSVAYDANVEAITDTGGGTYTLDCADQVKNAHYQLKLTVLNGGAAYLIRIKAPGINYNGRFNQDEE